MPNLGFQELIVIFLIILILFGAKKIPDIAAGLGRGIRDFKRAMKDTGDEIQKSATPEEPAKKSAESSDKKE
ncbi:MAG: twin-arginine translocase TatA/TatE family subunit [Candidatus Zixiibacteriota bacterium]